MGNPDRVFEGKDLQEALRSASEKLGIPEPDLDYEILEQGRRGLFGIGARSMRIRVKPPIAELDDHELRGERERREPRKGPSRPPAPPAGPAKSPPRKADPASGEEFLAGIRRMLELMKLDLTAETQPVDSGIKLSLQGPDRKLLTQKDGELISALQFLLNRMARRAWPGVGRIHVACDGDRERRDDELIELARDAARQVLETGKTRRLNPMNAYERRLVHIAVREHPGLGSRSEGGGYLKRVRIYKQKK